MKNYFNQHEATNHLVLITSMILMQNFIEGNSITNDEREMLEELVEIVEEFNTSVFGRLGEGYKKSVMNKATLNTLRLVSRYSPEATKTDMEYTIDEATLRDILDQTADIDCEMCKRTDCLQCGIYKIKSYLHYEGISDETNLCPFRKEKINFDYFD